ncbi:MAG: hypothetical protein OXL40_00685 [Bacteroidota bacterium]|nr:hypothetical protein [Bacteroidota bacterium]
MGDRRIQPFAYSGISTAKASTVRFIENHELLGWPFGVDVGRVMGEYAAV